MPATSTRTSPFAVIIGIFIALGLVAALASGHIGNVITPENDDEHAYAFQVETNYSSVKINVKRTPNFQPSIIDAPHAYPFDFEKAPGKARDTYADDGIYNPKAKGSLTVTASMNLDLKHSYTGYVTCRIFRVGETKPVVEMRNDKEDKRGVITVTCLYRTPPGR